MAHIQARQPQQQASPGQKNSAREPMGYVRSSFFKYYIHDGVDTCRLQLLGELSESDVPELSGCWATAKTTSAGRNVVLDLRGLKTVDDSGKQWVLSMAAEGALLLPETFLSDGLGYHPDADNTSAGFLNRVAAFLRGCRAIPAESSTQAR